MSPDVASLILFVLFFVGVPLFGYWGHTLELRDVLKNGSLEDALIDAISPQKETKYDKDNLYDLNNKRYYRVTMLDGEYIDVHEEDFWTDFEKLKNKKDKLNDSMNNKLNKRYIPNSQAREQKFNIFQ